MQLGRLASRPVCCRNLRAQLVIDVAFVRLVSAQLPAATHNRTSIGPWTWVWPDGKPDSGSRACSVVAPCGFRYRADPRTGVRPDIGVVILRCRDGTCGGVWFGVDQALAWCGDWCGLPNLCCMHCAISTSYAYQISTYTEQKRSLTWN